MIKTIEENAYAKINLTLGIKGKREDGYHELESIMVPIELHDKLYFEELADNEIQIEMSKNSILLQNNIIYKTAISIKEHYNIDKGVRITVEKNIPVEAGLAGGSADCAATIRALNKLFELHLTLEEMIRIANTLGSDTAFCVLGKPAIVSGRGDILEEIECNFTHEFYILKPNYGMSTAAIFKNHVLTESTDSIENVKKSLLENDKSLLINSWFNDLEHTVNKISSDMRILRNKLSVITESTLMSGSGSSIIVFHNDKTEIEEFAKNNNCEITNTKIYKKT